MSLRLITPPATEPVTLAEARMQLRDPEEVENDLITALITAARGECEHQIERSLLPQTWELALDCFNSVIRLPRPPIISMVSVKYIDSAGIQQTLDPSAYLVDTDSEPGRLQPAYGTSWPTARATPGAVRVRYTAGYADAASVPQELKAWIKIRIGTLFEHREQIIAGLSVAEVPFVDGLLDRYRIWSI